MLPQSIGLLKLMLNFISHVQSRELYSSYFTEHTCKIGFFGDTNEPNAFKLGMVLDMS